MPFNDQASFCSKRYSRSEQNENVRYIETWLWRFYNFNFIAGSCNSLWQRIANVVTTQTTSNPCIITRTEAVPLRCWMCTRQWTWKSADVNDDQTSVRSPLTPKFGWWVTVVEIRCMVIPIRLIHHFGRPFLSVFRRHRSVAKKKWEDEKIERFWCPKSVCLLLWSV